MESIPRIGICISTVAHYSQKTVPVLYTSLLQSGVHPRDILVVEGGHSTRKVIAQGANESMTIQTNHNSFDLTALIEIAEYNIVSDFWFLMHDTCRVGPNFKNALYSADFSKNKTALTNSPSMSIGLYKHSYIMEHRETLINSKFTTVTPKNVGEFKQRACNEEDLILWKAGGPAEVYCPKRTFQIVDDKWYPTATGRIQEYYPELDLYKLKANWGQGKANKGISII